MVRELEAWVGWWLTGAWLWLLGQCLVATCCCKKGLRLKWGDDAKTTTLVTAPVTTRPARVSDAAPSRQIKSMFLPPRSRSRSSGHDTVPEGTILLQLNSHTFDESTQPRGSTVLTDSTPNSATRSLSCNTNLRISKSAPSLVNQRQTASPALEKNQRRRPRFLTRAQLKKVPRDQDKPWQLRRERQTEVSEESRLHVLRTLAERGGWILDPASPDQTNWLRIHPTSPKHSNITKQGLDDTTQNHN